MSRCRLPGGLLWRQVDCGLSGPLYIFGAPSRQIEDGKAVLASEDILKSELYTRRLVWRTMFTLVT